MASDALAGVAELLADFDEFAGESAETLVLADLGLGSGHGSGREGARSALAVDVANQQGVGAVAGIAFLAAAAGGGAALHVAVHEGAGAQVPDGRECGRDAIPRQQYRGQWTWRSPFSNSTR